MYCHFCKTPTDFEDLSHDLPDIPEVTEAGLVTACPPCKRDLERRAKAVRVREMYSRRVGEAMAAGPVDMDDYRLTPAECGF